MKTALLTLLAVYVLLLAHIAPTTSRPMDRNSLDGSTVSLNRVLNEESTQALLNFLRENMTPNLDRGLRVLVSLSRAAPERLLTGHQMTLKELAHFLGTLYPLFQGTTSSAEEVERGSWEEFSERLKREGSPISADIMFQILKHLNEHANEVAKKQQQIDKDFLIIHALTGKR